MADSTLISGSAKTVTTRRKTKTSVILEPGTKGSPDSFIKLENPEATIAAYCGFDDIGKFRKFYIGPLVMPYYLKSLAYVGYRRRHVLSLLAECPYDRYWASDEDPEKVYPPSQHESNYRMALNLWQMLRGLRQGLSDNMPIVEPADFETLTACKFPSGAALDRADVPSFGPFADESELEPFNRCLCLFAHIKYTTNKLQWDRKFFGKSAWDASVSISLEYQPDWMRQVQSAVITEAPDEYTGPAVNDPPFSISVTWKHASKNKKNVAFVREKNEEDIFDEIPKSIVVTITREMGGSEVRDRIRQAFKLDKYEGNLEVLTLVIGEDEGISAMQRDWDIVLKAMLERPGMPTFWCVFRQLEDGEIPWEHNGPPKPLQTFVENREEDVAPKHNHTPDYVEQVQQYTPQVTKSNLETSFGPLVVSGHGKGGDESQANGRKRPLASPEEQTSIKKRVEV